MTPTPTPHVPRHDMTLTEMMRAFPHRFYPQQWYRGERFLNLYPSATRATCPAVLARGVVPQPGTILPHAVDLVHAYLRHPDALCWQLYWWCADTDAKGQRIYVGGVCDTNGHKLEVHRHLHISDQWAIPT